MKPVSDLLRQVGQNIASRQLVKPGQPILVAVSGGVDSMVLLHLLHTLSKQHDWKLTVAHLNHQLRGHSSQADERLVHSTALALGVPVVVERTNVRQVARVRKLSLEMAGREVRHQFLARAASERAIAVAALAHHADDQVELFFLRLLRGSGAEGMAGMLWRSASPADPGLDLIRPLLDVPKTALRQYAAQNDIAFRLDATNLSAAILRNRIRNQLLPLLRRNYQPGLNQAILRTMEIVGAESQAVSLLAQQWLKEAVRRRPETQTSFADLPLAVQRRCLQLQLLRLGVAAEFGWIETLRLESDKPVAIEGSPGPAGQLFAFRDQAGRVRLRRETGRRFNPDSLDLPLRGRAGEASFDGVTVQWKIQDISGARRPKRPTNLEVFDANKVGGHVRLRHWQPGDRYQPLGLKCAAKLQDLFVNKKIPRQVRHQLLVAAADDGELFWVEGLRISERFKLSEQTNRRLLWSWKRI